MRYDTWSLLLHLATDLLVDPNARHEFLTIFQRSARYMIHLTAYAVRSPGLSDTAPRTFGSATDCTKAAPWISTGRQTAMYEYLWRWAHTFIHTWRRTR